MADFTNIAAVQLPPLEESQESQNVQSSSRKSITQLLSKDKNDNIPLLKRTESVPAQMTNYSNSSAFNDSNNNNNNNNNGIVNSQLNRRLSENILNTTSISPNNLSNQQLYTNKIYLSLQNSLREGELAFRNVGKIAETLVVENMNLKKQCNNLTKELTEIKKSHKKLEKKVKSQTNYDSVKEYLNMTALAIQFKFPSLKHITTEDLIHLCDDNPSFYEYYDIMFKHVQDELSKQQQQQSLLKQKSKKNMFSNHHKTDSKSSNANNNNNDNQVSQSPSFGPRLSFSFSKGMNDIISPPTRASQWFQ